MKRLPLVVPYPPEPSSAAARAVRELASAAAKIGLEPELFAASPAPAELKRLSPRLARADAALERACADALKRAAHDPSTAVVVFDHAATRGALAFLRDFAPQQRFAVAAVDPRWSPAAGASYPAIAVDEVWRLHPRVPEGPLSDYMPRRTRTGPAPRALKDFLSAPRRASGFEPRPRELVSIVIPCWNGLRYTKECLKAVLRWTSGPFELVVVDDGSTDGTSAYVRKLADPRIRLERLPVNGGFARAVNAGTRKAQGEWIVWLNNDVVVGPGWLDRMIACARRAPWVGAVGPYTNEINGLQRLASARYRRLADFPGFAESVGLRNAGRARWAHRLAAFCLLVKRGALERAGFLDEGFGQGTYEDFDFCLRLRLAGFQLLVAEDVFVHHHGHKTFEANGVALDRLNAVNRDAFVEKWCRRALAFLDELDPELAAR